MSCFPISGSTSSPNITQAPRTRWSLVGPGNTHLLDELEKLYWQGVRTELENIVYTLKTWQQPEYSGVNIDEENDTQIHGFDTFIDQVSQQTRAFAVRYGEMKLEQEAKQSTQSKRMLSLSSRIEEKGTKIRYAVGAQVPKIPRFSGIQHRACMLLQAAGFLDIDKLIEHRPPLEELEFWARPAIPQLNLSRFEDDWTPQLGMLECSKCRSIIRGSMFVQASSSPTKNVCEGCYRQHYHGNPQYEKAYKHCILYETITPPISRKMCECGLISQVDEVSRLFPVPKGQPHIGNDEARCKLLKLGNQVALAKYHGLLSIVKTQQTQPKGCKKVASKLRSILHLDRKDQNNQESETIEISESKKLPLQDVSNNAAATEAAADEDIPLFFRQFTQQYPFGNVHMALRVGPLVIENGVAHTKGGALISPRQPPIFHERFSMGRSRQRSLAVGGDPDRRLWQQNRPVGNPKRYKAVMKQVVGVPFTGTLSQLNGSIEETKIIQRLIKASEISLDDPGMSATDKKKALDSALEPAMDFLKTLLQARVKIYLESIAKGLLNPKIPLTWSATSNNCQSFCNALIDADLFEPLVSSQRELYLMSFVCPQEGYLRNKVHTKYDVPSGLTEEYLLRFHFGRHDEADVIDTLQEYWYDWGAFGAPLYKYQDLFPWDCTEAYGRNPIKCGSCNLAKHILAFPFDAWSIVELHLARDQHMYASLSNIPDSWMHNRLLILTAFSILTRAAAAMSKTPSFCKATQWLHSNYSELRGNDPALTRVKLGGIHRAQPFSHYFEAGKYSHYFLAPWALRPRNEQIEEYEFLRDGRAEQADVGVGGMFGSSTRLSDADDMAYWAFQQQFIGFEGGGLSSNDQSKAGGDANTQSQDTDNHRENETGAPSASSMDRESTPDTSNSHNPASEDSHRDHRGHSGSKDISASDDHSKGEGNSTTQSQDTNHHRDNTIGAPTASNTKSGSKKGTKDSQDIYSGDDGGSHRGHSGKRHHGETHHSAGHSGREGHHSKGHHSDRDDYSDVGSLSQVSFSGLRSGGYSGGYSDGYSGGYSGGNSSSSGRGSSTYGNSDDYSSSSTYGGSSSYGGGGNSSSYGGGSDSNYN